MSKADILAKLVSAGEILADGTITAAELGLATVATSGSYPDLINKPTTLSGYGITDAQPLDADLTAIGALSGTSGLLKKTSANTWTLDTSTYLTGITSGQITTALGFTPPSVTGAGASGSWGISIAGSAAYVVPRTAVIADGTSITLNCDTTDIATQTNTQATGTLTLNAPTGTPVNGQKIMLRLTCTNVQTFSWNSVFLGSTDLPLPTASSSGGKEDYLGFIYDSTATKWHLIAKNFGF